MQAYEIKQCNESKFCDFFFIYILFKDNNLYKKKTNKLKARCFSHPDKKTQEEEDYITVNIKQ
jgi:hypothetical protein